MNILHPWSYSYIRKVADEATLLAKSQGLHPAPSAEVIRSYNTSRRFNIPFLGDFVPQGWEITDETVMVDTAGRERPAGAAVTQHELYRRIADRKDPDLGYGVIERNPTLAVIATYRKVLIPLSSV